MVQKRQIHLFLLSLSADPDCTTEAPLAYLPTMPSPLFADVHSIWLGDFFVSHWKSIERPNFLGRLSQEHASGQAERYLGFLFDTAQAIGPAVKRC